MPVGDAERQATYPNARAPNGASTSSRDYACSGSVYVSSVIHPKHGDRALFLVDAIQDAKRAASRTVDAGELVAELTANSLRVIEKGPGDEVDHSGSDTFKQLLAELVAKRLSA